VNKQIIPLALLVLVTTIPMVFAAQEVYGDHQAEKRNGPNPSDKGIEEGGEDHGQGLGDHGCNSNSKGFSNSGGECQNESVVE
jgi:hypothetical protein